MSNPTITFNPASTVMNRKEQFTEAVYNFVFQMLDAEPELTGLDAGCIAARTSQRFAEVYSIQMGLEGKSE